MAINIDLELDKALARKEDLISLINKLEVELEVYKIFNNRLLTINKETVRFANELHKTLQSLTLTIICASILSMVYLWK